DGRQRGRPLDSHDGSTDSVPARLRTRRATRGRVRAGRRRCRGRRALGLAATVHASAEDARRTHAAAAAGTAAGAGRGRETAGYRRHLGRAALRWPLAPRHRPDGAARLTGLRRGVRPHPHRVFRSGLMPWHDKRWGEDSPWMRMFYNARKFVN
ncbi:MAG: phosphoribosylformylglycinamidine synthase subunit PurQ, partial [Proteobacteria bacterium]|nr:phosphoribosylformylglycinamidine synthase subunit PurQ [Pseudomonadota bacterium]